VGITSPEHRCSSSSPGDVRGIELGMEEEPKETPVGCHTGIAEAEDESWSSCVRCGFVHDTTTMVGVDVMVVPGGGLGLSLLRFPAFQCHLVDPSINVSDDTLLSSLSRIALEQYRQEDERSLCGRFSCPVPLTDAR